MNRVARVQASTGNLFPLPWVQHGFNAIFRYSAFTLTSTQKQRTCRRPPLYTLEVHESQVSVTCLAHRIRHMAPTGRKTPKKLVKKHLCFHGFLLFKSTNVVTPPPAVPHSDNPLNLNRVSFTIPLGTGVLRFAFSWSLWFETSLSQFPA